MISPPNSVPPLEKFPVIEDSKIPGQMCFGGGLIVLNPQREAVILKVTNTGDRPIQVGSHYHFIEVNPSLIFDRKRAHGMRLNIPAGAATRFEVRLLTLLALKQHLASSVSCFC